MTASMMWRGPVTFSSMSRPIRSRSWWEASRSRSRTDWSTSSSGWVSRMVLTVDWMFQSIRRVLSGMMTGRVRLLVVMVVSSAGVGWGCVPPVPWMRWPVFLWWSAPELGGVKEPAYIQLVLVSTVSLATTGRAICPAGGLGPGPWSRWPGPWSRWPGASSRCPSAWSRLGEGGGILSRLPGTAAPATPWESPRWLPLG